MANVFDRFHLGSKHKNEASSSQNPYLPLDKVLIAARSRSSQLHRLGRSWDPDIRKMLDRLAGAKWPEPVRRRGIPIHSTRIRRTIEVEKVVWWVEHDIPPWDLYHCAAYMVELALDDARNPVITLRSGREEYRLEQPTVSSVAKQLARLSKEPPLVIPRRMGEAFD